MNDQDFPLRDLLEDPIEHQSLERIRRRVARSRHRSTRPSSAGLVIAAAAIVLLGIYVVWPQSGPGPVCLSEAGTKLDTLAASTRERTIDLDDGSNIVLQPGTRLEAIRNDDRDVALVMSEGRGLFAVAPGGPRRWSIDAGLAVIHVVGTEFEIERRSDRLRVTVEHGVVQVHGQRVEGGVARLEAGDSLEIRPEPEQTAAPVMLETEPVAELPSAVEAAAPTPREPSAAGPSWRELAREGQHRQAYSLLGRSGIESETQLASVEDLFELADVARLSGHPQDAIPPLERLLRDHRNAPRASVAAFTLGRTYLDVLQQPLDAARAFNQSLELGCPRSLEEQAWSRLVESHDRSANEAEATSAMRRYLRAHPSGANADSFRQRLSASKVPQPSSIMR